MQSRRNSMMARVCHKYARVPGQHGDGNVPAFYPVAINPSWWGQPFGKVKEGKTQILFFYGLVFPVALYWVFDVTIAQRTRIATVGKRPLYSSSFFRQIDLDDPDYEIKYQKLREEVAGNKLEVRWGGTNFLASYLWEPGDPEPDIRRREVHTHH
uniref:Uncharacterized protein n=1 Tax=Trypanosoma congolense (strain IL3000) TaxID=1068625 RepID=G0UZI5_TRYCI|nr:conserved hypothetical protein [Trypanosoma congolense IL3000]